MALSELISPFNGLQSSPPISMLIRRILNFKGNPKLAHILVKTSIRSKNILGEEVREKLANEQDIYDKLTEMAVDKVKLKDVSESKRYGSPPPEVYPKLKT